MLIAEVSWIRIEFVGVETCIKKNENIFSVFKHAFDSCEGYLRHQINNPICIEADKPSNTNIVK